MTNLKKEKKSLEEQIRYWKNKYTELEKKFKDLETYIRGYKDATYYLGGRK